MGSSEFSLFQQSPKKRSVFHKAPSLIADGFLFVGGASMVLSLVWALLTFINPRTSIDNIITWSTGGCGPDLGSDPSEPTFYDDPNLNYAFGEEPMKDWDLKRKEWLKLHPSFAASGEKVLLNPVGDHLQLRLFKNKVDYCRIHGHEIFYNNVLLSQKGTGS